MGYLKSAGEIFTDSGRAFVPAVIARLSEPAGLPHDTAGLQIPVRELGLECGSQCHDMYFAAHVRLFFA
jgi:hypothetical protein